MDTGTVSYRKYRNTVSVSDTDTGEKGGRYRYNADTEINTDTIIRYPGIGNFPCAKERLYTWYGINKHLQPNKASQRVTNHNLSVIYDEYRKIPKKRARYFSSLVTRTFLRGKTKTASMSFGRFSRLLRGPWPVAIVLYYRRNSELRSRPMYGRDRPRENVVMVAVASKPIRVAASSPICGLPCFRSFRSCFVCFVWFNNSSSHFAFSKYALIYLIV